MVMVVGCRGNRGGQENVEIEENRVGGPEGKEESRKSKVEKKSEERKWDDNLMMKSLRCRRR